MANCPNRGPSPISPMTYRDGLVLANVGDVALHRYDNWDALWQYAETITQERNALLLNEMAHNATCLACIELALTREVTSMHICGKKSDNAQS